MLHYDIIASTFETHAVCMHKVSTHESEEILGLKRISSGNQNSTDYPLYCRYHFYSSTGAWCRTW